MSVVELIKLVIGLSGVFTSPLPWQAELAFLIFCVFVVGMPRIIKSLRQSQLPEPRHKAKGMHARQTNPQNNKDT